MFDIGLNIDEFIITFIQRLRRDDRCKSKPSLRQGTALFQLLISRFARQQSLSVEDIISTAVLTTYYEDQKLAKEIAKELVISRVNEKIVDGKGPRTNSSYEKLLTIKNIAGDYLKDEEVLEEMLNKPYSEYEDMDGLIDLIFNAKKDHLTSTEIDFLSKRGRLEQFYDQIHDKELQTYADALLDNFKEMENKLEDLFSENLHDLTEMMDTLNKLTDSSREVKQAFEKLVSKLDNFEDYQNLVNKGNTFVPPSQDQLEKLSLDHFSQAIQQAQEIDQKLGSNLTEKIFQEFINRDHQFSVNEICESYNDGQSWSQELQKKMNSLKKFSTKSEISEALKKLSQNRDSFPDRDFKDQMSSAMQSLSNEQISQTASAADFAELMENFQSENIPFDQDQAQHQGESLNIPPEDLEPILNKKKKRLDEMMSMNLDNYSEFLQYLDDFPPGEKECWGLVEQGIQLGSSSMLGAMGSIRLDETANQVANHNDQQITEKFMQGITRGSGENLLKNWYNARDHISPKIRHKIGDLVRNSVVDMAISNAKKYFGFVKSGILMESSRFRPYRVGDDIDLVSLDETIANLIDLGKPLNQITNADIISHDEKGRSVKLIIVIDKSGSMEGKKFAISTLAASTLLYLLKADEIAIIAFDNNTYPLKKVEDPADLDLLTDTLINLEAGGGTQFQRTLEYIRSILDRYSLDQKFMVCIFSDFAFFDRKSELKAELMKLQKFDPHFVAFYTDPPDRKNLLLFKTFGSLQEAFIPSVNQLPKVLAEILRRFT